jgi:hypothetical protein
MMMHRCIVSPGGQKLPDKNLQDEARSGNSRHERRLRRTLEHDPEKWIPVFGKDHAPPESMIPKKPAPDLIRGGYRFSEKIMLQQEAGAG